MARAAFAEAWGRYPDDFGPAYEHDSELFEAIVRAVLAKLREPTPLMLAHGWAAINKGRKKPVDMAPGPALREAFPAMIDAILADAGPGRTTG